MVSDKLTPDPPFALVLTFDGRRERGLLEGVADRFNGRILLWFPLTRGRGGLEALCESLREHLERAYRRGKALSFMPVLVLGDKEHFRAALAGRAAMADELKAVMASRGLDVLSAREMMASRFCGLLAVEGRYGHRPFRALVVVLGEQRCAEENLAFLARRLGLERVPSMARELRKLLADRGEVPDSLLEEAFPCLCAALRELHGLLAGERDQDGREAG